jgi:hypothetical protein
MNERLAKHANCWTAEARGDDSGVEMTRPDPERRPAGAVGPPRGDVEGDGLAWTRDAANRAALDALKVVLEVVERERGVNDDNSDEVASVQKRSKQATSVQ